jgi:hypothetical protein
MEEYPETGDLRMFNIPCQCGEPAGFFHDLVNLTFSAFRFVKIE